LNAQQKFIFDSNASWKNLTLERISRLPKRILLNLRRPFWPFSEVHFSVHHLNWPLQNLGNQLS